MLNKSIQFISLLSLTLLKVMNLIPTRYTDNTFIGIVLVVWVIATLSFLFLRKEYVDNLHKQYIKFSTLFIISVSIIHFQAYIDLYLGLIDEDQTRLWVDKDIINNGIVLSAIALIAFYLGYSINNGYKDQISYRSHLYPRKSRLNVSIIKSLNVIFFIIFLSQLNSDFLNSSLYGSGHREMGSLFSYTVLLYETSFIAIIVLNIFNNKVNKFQLTLKEFLTSNLSSFIVLTIYISLVALSGDRGPIIYLTLSAVSGYFISSNKKISKLALLSLILVGSIAITLLGIVRTLDNKSLDSIKDAGENVIYPSSISPATKELAGSIRTLQVAIDAVPNKYPHTYGWFSMLNTSILIPGLNGIINQSLNTDILYLSSDNFLTIQFLGYNPTWGIGTSCIADTYLDFGTYGILIIFLLFGYFSRFIESNIYMRGNPSIILIATYVVFFSLSIYIGRSSLVVPFTKLTYVLIFSYIPVILKKV